MFSALQLFEAELRKRAGHFVYSGGKIGFGQDEASRLAWSDAQKTTVKSLDKDLNQRVANIRNLVYHSDNGTGSVDVTKVLRDFDSFLRHMSGFQATNETQQPSAATADGFFCSALHRISILWQNIDAARGSSEVCLLEASIFELYFVCILMCPWSS